MTLTGKPTNWYELVGYLHVHPRVYLSERVPNQPPNGHNLTFERATPQGFLFRTEHGNWRIVPAPCDKATIVFHAEHVVFKYNENDPPVGVACLILSYKDDDANY